MTAIKIDGLFDALTSTRNWIVEKSTDVAKAAGKTVQPVYDEVATRTEDVIAEARRVAGDFAENVDSAMQARKDAAFLGLGGRIRR